MMHVIFVKETGKIFRVFLSDRDMDFTLEQLAPDLVKEKDLYEILKTEKNSDVLDHPEKWRVEWDGGKKKKKKPILVSNLLGDIEIEAEFEQVKGKKILQTGKTVDIMIKFIDFESNSIRATGTLEIYPTAGIITPSRFVKVESESFCIVKYTAPLDTVSVRIKAKMDHFNEEIISLEII